MRDRYYRTHRLWGLYQQRSAAFVVLTEILWQGIVCGEGQRRGSARIEAALNDHKQAPKEGLITTNVD
jgi:hypothetical protein